MCRSALRSTLFPYTTLFRSSLGALGVWSFLQTYNAFLWPLVIISDSTQYTLPLGDRKSTRLNSSHVAISYAVFCLKKKRTNFSQSLPLLFASVDQTAPTLRA